jgi:hypothetical protein
VLLIGYSFTGNFWLLIDNKSIKEKNGNSMSQNLSIKVSNPVVIPMSNNRDNPVCIDPTDTLTIIISCKVTNISVKLYKLVEGETDEALPPVFKEDSYPVNPNGTITITPKLEEGEEYRVDVCCKDNEWLTGYFAVNYSFDLENGIDALKSDRKLVVCISDIHLGMDDTYTECKENRTHLENFLTKIKLNHNVEELVIAGDFIDEWFIPATVDTFDGKTQQDFVQKVKDKNNNNSAIFTAINAIADELSEAKLPVFTVTYVPGNHDLLITSDEINDVLPKVNPKTETQGLGSYSPKRFPEAIIEHGHRYNFFCAPDPLSNSKIAKIRFFLLAIFLQELLSNQ